MPAPSSQRQEDEKPVRAGVYQTIRFDGKRGYSHFDGEFWGYQAGSRKSAELWGRGPNRMFAMQRKEWRGLAQEPKE
ncbi:protein of unknown function [Ralstonia solanacearum CMR15]|nr:protein of unknown function [Ralstonia solanacearum CMR15]